ncbi:MAG: aminotransferase class I/II-fold pyridoxal phosphate-dependent enzyme, partial [Methanomicrobiales archaeon]|nr:aminotransferase class I/II-fold pyridoxal phosphate-dependent enzyme [Methanomicrobiales archaeon]
SLTKSFAIPGLRFGYGFGNPELIARIEAVRLPWTVNTVAEAYALEAFRQYDRLEESRQRIAQERAWLFQEIRNLGVQVERSEANFLLIHLLVNAHQFADQMVRHGILIRDCTSFGLPRSIRVAVMRREENHQLIEAMRACLP